MAERPILFSAPMVRAILAGTKTQTRRAVKPMPGLQSEWLTAAGIAASPKLTIARSGEKHPGEGPLGAAMDHPKGGPLGWVRCPYGQPGDRLWVRETWRHTCDSLEESRALTEDITSGTAVDYRATYVDELMRNGPMARADAEECCEWETWKPSIHMPRWASRILLEVTDVRVQRLQDISEADAVAEGIDGPLCAELCTSTPWRNELAPAAVHAYAALWDHINGAGAWDANPWVWAVSFRRARP